MVSIILQWQVHSFCVYYVRRYNSEIVVTNFRPFTAHKKVEPGHKGVKYSRIGGLDATSQLNPGINLIIPWFQRAIIYDLRARNKVRSHPVEQFYVYKITCWVLWCRYLLSFAIRLSVPLVEAKIFKWFRLPFVFFSSQTQRNSHSSTEDSAKVFLSFSRLVTTTTGQ